MKLSKFFPNEWNVEYSRLRISGYLLLDVLTAVFWVVFQRKKSYFDSLVIMVSKWQVKISAIQSDLLAIPVSVYYTYYA